MSYLRLQADGTVLALAVQSAHRADIDAELAAAAIVLFVDHARRQPAHARYSAGRVVLHRALRPRRPCGLEARGFAEPVAPTLAVARDVYGAGTAQRVEIILRRDVQAPVALANRVPVGLAVERAKPRAPRGRGE